MIIHFFSHLFWEVSALFNSIPFSFFSPPTYCCLPTNAPFLSIVLAKVNWPYIRSSLWLIFNPNFLSIFTTWHCRHSRLGTPLACGFHDADLFPLPLAFFSCFFTPSFPIYLPFPLLVLAPTLPRGACSAFLHQLSLIYIYILRTSESDFHLIPLLPIYADFQCNTHQLILQHPNLESFF